MEQEKEKNEETFVKKVVQTALEAERQIRRQQVLHNTRMLMEEYIEMKRHIESAVSEEEELKEEQYDMYGDHFGKSLCHAWAASPIYFLAKYFAGLDLVNKDGVTYILKPQMQYFTELDCTLPVGSNGVVRLVWDGEILEITPNADGGILELGEQKLSLVRGETRRVKI